MQHACRGYVLCGLTLPSDKAATCIECAPCQMLHSICEVREGLTMISEHAVAVLSNNEPARIGPKVDRFIPSRPAGCLTYGTILRPF